MKLDTGGPARPTIKVREGDNYNPPVKLYCPSQMTWLDECAMRIAPALISEDITNTEVAQLSYNLAREMLAEKRRLEGGGE